MKRLVFSSALVALLGTGCLTDTGDPYDVGFAAAGESYTRRDNMPLANMAGIAGVYRTGDQSEYYALLPHKSDTPLRPAAEGDDGTFVNTVVLHRLSETGLAFNPQNTQVLSKVELLDDGPRNIRLTSIDFSPADPQGTEVVRDLTRVTQENLYDGSLTHPLAAVDMGAPLMDETIAIAKFASLVMINMQARPIHMNVDMYTGFNPLAAQTVAETLGAIANSAPFNAYMQQVGVRRITAMTGPDPTNGRFIVGDRLTISGTADANAMLAGLGLVPGQILTPVPPTTTPTPRPNDPAVAQPRRRSSGCSTTADSSSSMLLLALAGLFWARRRRRTPTA